MYLSKREFTWHNNCPPEYYYIVQNSFSTSIDIASNLADKLSTVEQFLGFLPQRQDANPSGRVTLETFEAIYGKVLWDRTEPSYKSNNEAGLKRVTYVLKMAQKLASLPHNKTLTNQLEVMCDEKFWDYRFTEKDKDYYKDTRPEEAGGGRVMQLSGPACIGKTMGYSWASKTHSIDNIVLCPMPLARWDGMKDFSIEMFRHIDLSANYGRMTLGAMMSIWSEARDLPCPSNPGIDSYGWECITELGRTKPEESIQNADSFAFLGVALYLYKADWHTGFCEPLPGEGNVVIPRPPQHTPSPTPQSSPTPTPQHS
ncbi:hypothetical protein PISL3812_09582 [Talaromyces islandicus]|uniref:Uncharacterized protein n=1 Tax=Talaromyces islandicus TaxID=28573 RepID=A0A0U1MBR1_TALIS|nr:hypothetical protein PISL3812_09582 [Talaromyces islandicus]